MFPLERPTGVSVLSALQFIGGLALILLGALILTAGDYVGAILGDSAATLYYILGVVLAAVGIVYLFIAHGLWTGRGWAWTVTVVFAVIGLVGSVAEYAVGLAFGGSASFFLAVLPNAVILLYLTRSHVRAFFDLGPRHSPPSVINYTEMSMKHLVPYQAAPVPDLSTFESNYAEEVLTDLANNPTESTKVVSAFHESGQSGVADYLKSEDPDLTHGEANAIAFAIILDMDTLVPAARNTTATGFSPSSPDKGTVPKAGSEMNDSERESEKEKSWIDRWLQR